MSLNWVKFSLACFALLLGCACTPSPEEARAKIDALELPFDENGIGNAVMTNDTKLLELFITAGYDVNEFDDAKRAPLMLSTRLTHRPTIEVLIAAGARAEELPGVLNIPATRGDVRTLSMLLDVGADIDSVDASRRTALLAAIEYSRLDSLSFLLDKGAHPDGNRGRPGPRGTNPLIEAIRSNQMEIVDLLIDAGADPRKTAGSIDAIQAAERAGYADLAQRLREISPN